MLAPASGSAVAATSGRQLVADAQRFWAEQMPSVYGRDWETVPESRIQGVTASRPPSFACDGETGHALFEAFVVGNAVGGYCFEGPIVVWDASPGAPFTVARSRFGTAGAAAITAHEIGHVVQGQIELDRRTVVLEQQADCFAGAYFAWSADHGGLANSGPESLGAAVSEVLEVGDPPGSRAVSSDAHGSGFDRVRAFQDGLRSGAGRCRGYARGLPRLFEVPFQDPEETANGGNLTLGELTAQIAPDLNRYFASIEPAFTPITFVPIATGPDCVGIVPATTVCGIQRTVSIDETQHRRINRQVGDGGNVVLLAMAWSDAGIGARIVDPVARYDYNACRAGGFLRAAADTAIPGSDATSSAGDLDEALIVLLRRARISRLGTGISTSIGFRTGVLGRAAACVAPA